MAILDLRNLVVSRYRAKIRPVHDLVSSIRMQEPGSPRVLDPESGSGIQDLVQDPDPGAWILQISANWCLICAGSVLD